VRYVLVPIVAIVSWMTTPPLLSHNVSAQDPAGTKISRSQPAVEEVLENYVKALGGHDAIAGISSRVMKGKFQGAKLGDQGNIESYWKSPDKSLFVLAVPGRGGGAQGFDGTTGFSQDPRNGFREMTANAVVHWKRNNDPQLPIKMKEYFTKLASSSSQSIGGHETNCLELTAPVPTPDTWCFDSKSGLLLSRSFEPNAEIGKIEFLYEDYREVDGVKVPFLVRQISRMGMTTYKYEQISYNVTLEDSRFAASGYRK
jgi:zinc protease